MILQPVFPNELWMVPEGSGAANHYVLRLDSGSVLFETARDPHELLPKLEDSNLRPVRLVGTHGHYDHIGFADAWRESTQAPLAIGRAEADWLTDPNLNLGALTGSAHPAHQPAEQLWMEGERHSLDSKWLLEVWETPGHTSGSCCYLLSERTKTSTLLPRALFTGDTLIGFTVGRTDLPGGSDAQLEESLHKLALHLKQLPEYLPVLSGHGPVYPLYAILEHNPWLPQV